MRTKCFCGEQYVIAKSDGKSASCGLPSCVEPVDNADRLPEVVRPQHDDSPTPHRTRGGQTNF